MFSNNFNNPNQRDKQQVKRKKKNGKNSFEVFPARFYDDAHGLCQHEWCKILIISFGLRSTSPKF